MAKGFSLIIKSGMKTWAIRYRDAQGRDRIRSTGERVKTNAEAIAADLWRKETGQERFGELLDRLTAHLENLDVKDLPAAVRQVEERLILLEQDPVPFGEGWNRWEKIQRGRGLKSIASVSSVCGV